MCNFIKRSKLLMVSFFVICFLSLFLSFIFEININNETNEDIHSIQESIYFTCHNENQDLLKLDCKYTLIKDNKEIKGLYSNQDIEIKPDLFYGRFFKVSDFNNNNNYVVIGKNLLSNVLRDNGKLYYVIANHFFEVIGIMGSTEEKTVYDDMIYANLDALIKYDSKYLNGTFIINTEDGDKLFNKLSDVYNNEDVKILRIGNAKKIDNNISNSGNFDFTIFKIMVSSVIFVIIFGVTKIWIKGICKEIALRRSMGASKIKIIKSIVLSLVLFSIISHLAGSGAFVLFSYLACGQIYFYIESASYVLFISIIAAFIAIVIPLIRLMKLQLSEVLR